MTMSMFLRLEQAVAIRSALVADLLQPGLTEPEIKRGLDAAGLRGDFRAVIELYVWKDGTRPGRNLALSETAFFPESIYQFLPLRRALALFEDMQQASRDLVAVTGDPTGISSGVGRYFPIFWDGSDRELGIDLAPGHQNRVVVIDFASSEPFREAYSSFDAFLEDAIRANEKHERLSCFKT